MRRAERAFGGYGPSATFRLLLADERRAFFKAIYPVPAGSPVRWSMDLEQRVLEELGDVLRPWAPAFLGAMRIEGWHALLMEDVGPPTVPPWTMSKARAALRSYAEFHARTLGRALPRWVPRRRRWSYFGETWLRFAAAPRGAAQLARLAGSDARAARAWIRRHTAELDAAARGLLEARAPHALLHVDTRSDNIRVHPRAAAPLRIFDWPGARVGAPELDLAAFVQSIVCEGGPPAETLVGWYAEVLPVRERVLTGAVAGIAGYFAENAWKREVDALPRLRSIQRRQLRSALAWAARLLDLPEPTWLQRVPS